MFVIWVVFFVVVAGFFFVVAVYLPGYFWRVCGVLCFQFLTVIWCGACFFEVEFAKALVQN